jgi:uncharacterized protein (DUF1015 family)
MSELGREELEEPVELVRVAPKRRRQRDRVGILRSLQGADLHLQLAAEPLDAPQDSNRVALAETGIEQLDVAPHPRLDTPAGVGELDGEIGRPRASLAAFLARDRVDSLHDPVLGEVGDRGHRVSLGARHVGTLAAMADVQPFRAVRYSGAAGPLAELVAPPYDTVSEEQRERLFERSLYNVLRLTLPDSAEDAGRLYRSWLSGGVLAREDDPASWLQVERYVGPDGVERERSGLVASVAAEPYSTGAVLPHERTNPPIRDDRLRLLRATRVQAEPIFLLADRALDLEPPDRPPELEVDGSRLWRLGGVDPRSFLDDSQLLIADGHHRYESTVAFGSETGGPAARIMALVVSLRDPGLHVFPTHRVFSGRPDLRDAGDGEPLASLDDAVARLADEPYDRAAAIAYRAGSIELVRGGEGELDVELVDRHGLDGISYTPRLDEAAAAVDSGEADVAFILREPRVEDVFSTARRGERMPQKSTYFFPKPLSGLLFHPLDLPGDP